MSKQKKTKDKSLTIKFVTMIEYVSEYRKYMRAKGWKKIKVGKPRQVGKWKYVLVEASMEGGGKE